MNYKPLTINHELILGVKVDFISLPNAMELISGWLKDNKKRYIVTPNVEIIMAAQKDKELKDILNDADLSIADSLRLDWASRMAFRSFLGKISLWPFFLFPTLLPNPKPSLTGTDLMLQLVKLASKEALKVALIGGREGVAKRVSENLEKKFPGLKVVYAESGGEIDSSGEQVQENDHNTKYMIQDTDFLFVGFGHGKQEKWIEKNKNKRSFSSSKINAKIFMAVGGALDYFSGEIKRAPKVARLLGFEWVFRLTMQPWRIRRFGSLVKFVFLVLVSPKS